MIGIIEYESGGNIHAIKNALNNIGVEYIASSDPEQFENCRKVILPGVGSFDTAVNSLRKSGFEELLKTLVNKGTADILGICVGFQILAKNSEEGEEDGFGFYNASVKKFSANRYPVPHMGWNSLIDANHPIFRGVDFEKGFYFLHSYRFDGEFCSSIAKSTYGEEFCCAAGDGKVFGVQFHPEKSHANGLQLLKNFIEIDLC